MHRRRDRGTFRDIERAPKEAFDVGHDVDRGVGRVAIVHDHDRHVVLGYERGHVGIALQPPNVVDHHGARIERPCRDLGLHRIDRDGDADLLEPRQDRCQPRQLFLGRDRNHPAIGTGGFGPDIDDVGTLSYHALGLGDGSLRHRGNVRHRRTDPA